MIVWPRPTTPAFHTIAIAAHCGTPDLLPLEDGTIDGHRTQRLRTVSVVTLMPSTISGCLKIRSFQHAETGVTDPKSTNSRSPLAQGKFSRLELPKIHGFPIHQTVNVALANQRVLVLARTQYVRYTAAVQNTNDVSCRSTPRH